ncbi:MAG: sensor histidine kinase [Acidimicrobiia bacterium]|nr:sensor histidine kinase [Acidimicrobiia bacterium]
MEAADSERRRIARDLHDGLQTRLILLAIAAERIRTDAPDGSAAAAEELQTGLQAAIGELRELVTGVVPAALTQGGLYAAAEDLADRAPIPIELTLEPAQTRLPAAVESTGYFVLSEALTNAFKHAGARELRVYLGQRNGHLRIEVHDDGVGGAELANGAGLRSMADRVEAHEGSLLIESSPVGGTRITVEVPCAS